MATPSSAKRGKVKKSPMSGYKFKQVGNNRGPVMGYKSDTGSGRYGQGKVQSGSRRDSSVDG